MVRNIVGALLDVGISKKSPNSIKEIIDSSDRKLCGKMVPDSGLYLMSVLYPKKYKIFSKQKFNLF